MHGYSDRLKMVALKRVISSLIVGFFIGDSNRGLLFLAPSPVYYQQ